MPNAMRFAYLFGIMALVGACADQVSDTFKLFTVVTFGECRCEGKQCGDDNCGGVCGFCDVGSVCDDTYQCVFPNHKTLSSADFDKSYKDYAKGYNSLRALQVVADKTVLQEYVYLSNQIEQVFAGHVGGFYAAPFFSAARSPASANKSFNVGLGFADLGKTFWEQPSSLDEGRWSPSKLVVSKKYIGADGEEHAITASKFGLPNARAFALKVQVAYQHPDPVNHPSYPGMGVLFWINIPGIGMLPNGTWYKGGCEDVPPVAVPPLPPICPSSGGTRRLGEAQNQFYYYDESTQICFPFMIITDKAGIFSSRIEDHTDDGHSRIVDDFKNDGSPALNNGGLDDLSKDGSKVGVFFQPDQEEAGKNYNIVFLAAVGKTQGADACGQMVARWLGNYRVDNIETLADQSASLKRDGLYQYFPKFESRENDVFSRMYIQGFSHLPLAMFKKDSYTIGANHNGYEPLNLTDTYVQMAPFFGQCAGMYPWDNSFFSYAWALADPQGLKEQILKFLALDWKTQRCYDNIYGRHCADKSYSFHYWSLSRIIYDLVTTGYADFLSEVHPGAYGQMSILDYLKTMADEPEIVRRRWDGQTGSRTTQLVDFGTDHRLWEYGYGCDHGGKLTGFVFAPNAERYAQNKMLADLLKRGGASSEAEDRDQHAQGIKTEIFDKLWDETNKSFMTISIYNPDADEIDPDVHQRTIYSTAPCNRDLNNPDCGTSLNIRDGGLLSDVTNLPTPTQLHTLDYNDFWSFAEGDGKITGLVQFAFTNPDTNFIGPNGFTSFPMAWDQTCYKTKDPEPCCCGANEYHWCKRQDFQGPGLYTGEIAQILKGLFKQGFQEQAMDMLNRYSYLADIPVWTEALPYNATYFDIKGYAVPAHMEGGISFTEVFIKGLFGVDTSADHTSFFPRIPNAFGETFLTDVNVQGHKFSVHINADGTVHQLDMCASCGREESAGNADHTRVAYGTQKKTRVLFTIRNLVEGSYTAKIDGSLVCNKATVQGTLVLVFADWNGLHLLSIAKSASS